MRKTFFFLSFVFLISNPGRAYAVDLETGSIPVSPFFMQFDTAGMPSSLTILDEDRGKVDLSIKETARFLMIAASRAFYNGNLTEADERIQDGMRRGFYVLPQLRLLSRLNFMDGRLDSAVALAEKIAAETDAIHDDQLRYQFLKSIEEYLKTHTETPTQIFRPAVTIHGDEKARHRFITPVGLKSDELGRILLTSFGTNEVVVFSKGLEFQMKLSGIENPFDVATDPDGDIYVTSFGGERIYRFKRDGARAATFGKGGSGPGEFFGASGIDISPDRYVYVVDAGNHRVQKFTPDGKFLMSFGSRGEKAGQLLSPRAVRVRPSPGSADYTVYVLSQEGQLLQEFDRYGNFLAAVPTPRIAHPTDFDWFGEHEILFSTSTGELVVLNLETDTSHPLMDEWGRPITVPGASGLTVDDEAGLIYVSNQTTSDLVVFQRSALSEKILLSVTGLDFEHYPYIGMTLRVTNGTGDPITGLTRRNFKIEEDNHPTTPVTVKPQVATGPLNLVVHVDPSSALDRRIVLVRSILTDLSRQIPPGYNLSIRKGRKSLLEPTDNPYYIRKSLGLIDQPEPASFVEDLRASIDALKPSRGRRNILVLTSRQYDVPPESYVPLYLWLTNYNVSLFVLHLGDQQLPTLKKLCRQTGGSYGVLSGLSLSNLAFELASSKTGSYFVVYASPFGRLKTNVPMDLVVRLFYLSGSVSDHVVYFAP